LALTSLVDFSRQVFFLPWLFFFDPRNVTLLLSCAIYQWVTPQFQWNFPSCLPSFGSSALTFFFLPSSLDTFLLFTCPLGALVPFYFSPNPTVLSPLGFFANILKHSCFMVRLMLILCGFHSSLCILLLEFFSGTSSWPEECSHPPLFSLIFVRARAP